MATLVSPKWLEREVRGSSLPVFRCRTRDFFGSKKSAFNISLCS
jgi:hypothetical protein